MPSLISMVGRKGVWCVCFGIGFGVSFVCLCFICSGFFLGHVSTAVCLVRSLPPHPPPKFSASAETEILKLRVCTLVTDPRSGNRQNGAA